MTHAIWFLATILCFIGGALLGVAAAEYACTMGLTGLDGSVTVW